MIQKREIISLEHTTFTYNEEDINIKPAVNDVSFSIYEGEWVAIVGHNGSGKSTMARLINGLLFPQKGTVRVFGELLTEENLWETRSKMGMVFQNPDNQFVGATVQDDVAFALENNGVPFEEMVEQVNESLVKVNMRDFMNSEPHHLSGGQKQRVAIAGAIALKPNILLLDEATSMLDPQGKEEVLSTVRQLREATELTVISITHDLEETLLADRVIMMNRGEKYAEGTPQQIFERGQELVDLGLDLPFAMKMSKLLKAEGIELVTEHMSEEELVNDLWTSHFNK